MQTRTKLANVDNVNHSDLERDVIAYLYQNGFQVEDEGVYHKRMKDAQRLSGIVTSTALYERTRPDFFAYHTRYPIAFYVDAKTHSSHRLHDMCIEAYPLHCRIQENRISGVMTLYVYRNSFQGHELECGFWTDAPPPVAVIYIPTTWAAYWQEHFRQVFRETWKQQTLIKPLPSTNGSDDPFAVIREPKARLMPHWQQQIDLAIELGRHSQ